MSGHWARGYLGLAGADQNGGNGGGGGMKLTLTMTDDTIGTLDATYAQVKAALRAGTEVFFVGEEGTEFYRYTLHACEDGGADDPNHAYFAANGPTMSFTAAAEDDLLTVNLGG